MSVEDDRPTDNVMMSTEEFGVVDLDLIDASAEFTVESRTQRQMVIRRFFRHRLAMVSLAILMFIVLLAFVGHLVVFDRFISAWEPGRTVATIGPRTPNFEGNFWETMVDYAGHQVLPSLALVLIGFATYMRFTRASMLDTLKSDYVRTAKAKGLPATQVVMRHAFRTALIPVMTVITISFAAVIDGAIITEQVFGWKGMGSLFIEGLNDVDPYPVMGFVVVTSVSVVLLNAIADILYAYLDPRIRT